jgi:hypothetical protein
MAELSTDYIGRITDIDIFGPSEDPDLQEVTLTFGSGNVVAGPYKEAQKFLRVLLSDRGTLLGETTYGTGFFKKLAQGAILNEAQFRAYFASAKAKALAFIYTSKLVGGRRDPRFLDDEMIKDVNIYSLDIRLETIRATFTFTFIDNDANIIIPVGIPVGV